MRKIKKINLLGKNDLKSIKGGIGMNCYGPDWSRCDANGHIGWCIGGLCAF